MRGLIYFSYFNYILDEAVRRSTKRNNGSMCLYETYSIGTVSYKAKKESTNPSFSNAMPDIIS